MTDKLVFLELYMTDVRDSEEVSYGDLFHYFDQIRDDHQPNPTQPSNDDRSLFVFFFSILQSFTNRL